MPHLLRVSVMNLSKADNNETNFNSFHNKIRDFRFTPICSAIRCFKIILQNLEAFPLNYLRMSVTHIFLISIHANVRMLFEGFNNRLIKISIHRFEMLKFDLEIHYAMCNLGFVTYVAGDTP